MLHRGVRLAGGSDFSVEVLAPLWGLQRVVTRTEFDGTPPGGWFPEQAPQRPADTQGPGARHARMGDTQDVAAPRGSIGAAVVGRYCGEGKIDSVRPVRSSSSRSA